MLIRTSLLALDQAARLQFNIGDGLDLWLDDRRLGARQDDRKIALRLTGESVADGLRAVHVRGQIGSVPIDLSYQPEPNLFFSHVWDGTSDDPSAPGSPSNLVTELQIGWEMAAAASRPARIKWWHQTVVVGGIDLRSLGCGGVTPDVVHHYDAVTDIMWRGNGSRMTSARATKPRHLSRLAIKPSEIAVADGEVAHVFDRAGNFKRTLSTLKGHEVASARTDGEGRVTAWARSGHKYTIDRRNDSEALLRSPAGVWAVIDFDERGRAVAVTDQDKSMATLEYTPTGGLSRVVDSAGLVTEIQRDELGRVIRFADSTGRQLDLARHEFGSGSEVTVVTAEGRETKHRSERLDDGTFVQSHTCCGAANPRVIEHRSLGPLGDERIVRTPEGMVATVRSASRSDNTGSTEVRRTSIASPAGTTMNIERRTDRHRTGRTDETVTVGEATSTKQLDPKTHTTWSRSAAGKESAARLVPGKSLLIETAGAGSLEIEFDDNGRPRRRERAGEIMTYGYDQNGRLTWTDFERWRQHIHHNEQGRISAIETPDGWLQIARDAAGRVTALQAPSDSVTTIARRPDGVISSIHYPSSSEVGEVEQMIYDRDGLLVGHQYGADHLVVYERDVAGRVINVVAPGVKISSTYDAVTGQLSGVASVDGDSVRYEHDGDLECLEEAMGRSAGRVERAFDDNHRVAVRRVNGAHDVQYRRNLDGRITGVGPLQFERSQKTGLPVALHLGGLTTTRKYDSFGRIQKHETRFGKLAMVFFGEEIERDDFGRVSQIKETAQGRERVINYSYSEARRLESVTVDGEVTLSLTYDSNGNITELNRLGRAMPLEADAADRLVRVAGQTTTHDECGNFTGIGQGGAVRSYQFDGLGRLVGSRDAHHEVVHVLDAIGRPIRISGAGAPTRLLWDGDRVAATLSEQGQVDIRFLDSGTGACPEALTRGGASYMLVTDHLGSVRAVVEAENGAVVQTLNYDALGRPIVNTDPGWQPFGFAGGLHETVGGLVRFQARTYDPFIGRFLSRDPLGFAGGQVNLYQYALGDPVNNVDPTGMLVGPSGEINACDDNFIGKRPLSADHVYMRSDAWTSGMTPLTTLGVMGRALSTWTKGSTFGDPACRKLDAIVAPCAGESFDTTPLAGSWTQTSLCFGDEWSALQTAAHPGAWQFDASAWDQGRGVRDTFGRLARIKASFDEFRPVASDRLSALIESMFP